MRPRSCARCSTEFRTIAGRRLRRAPARPRARADAHPIGGRGALARPAARRATCPSPRSTSAVTAGRSTSCGASSGSWSRSTASGFTPPTVRVRARPAQGRELAAHGITVIRFTWDQLDDAPLAVIARVSGLLAQRADRDQARLAAVAAVRRRRSPAAVAGRRSAAAGGPAPARRLGDRPQRRPRGAGTAPPRLGSGPSSFQAEPGRAGSRSTMKNPTKVRIEPEGQPDALGVALALGQPGRARGREQPDEQQVQGLGADRGAETIIGSPR